MAVPSTGASGTPLIVPVGLALVTVMVSVETSLESVPSLVVSVTT